MGEKKIIIIGAGIAGLTAALRLRAIGYNPHIIERAKSIAEYGAGIQLSPNASRLLIELGAGEHIEQAVATPLSAQIRHYKTNHLISKTSLGAQAEDRYGAPYWSIHRHDLIKGLAAAVKKAKIPMSFNVAISHYHQENDEVSVFAQDQLIATGDVLIGADGIRSTVSQQMSGATKVSFTGEIAWRGLVSREHVPATSDAAIQIWAGPEAHFVAYPIRQNSLINFVAITSRDQWLTTEWNTQGDISELRAHFSDWHDQVQSILVSVDKVRQWGLFAQAELSCWHQGRVVLMGDACHAMLPYMAQGAAMAIEDAYFFGTALQTNTSYEEAFIAYERHRRPRTQRMKRRAKANAHLFHANTPGAKLKQSLTFKTIGALRLAGIEPLDWIYSYRAGEVGGL